jgi:acyl carrier protein
MPSYDEIVGELCGILAPYVPDGFRLKQETDLVGDLGLDSLQVMKILEAVEDRFDVSVPLNVLPDLRTVKDFAVQLQRITEDAE